ncbi:MAG: hypothetical protein P4L56_21915 [Candidatus Sulfopaludibacter sp.]|nr:hypothetical protein [Candidatus Sulfopaludibacter sp.]
MPAPETDRSVRSRLSLPAEVASLLATGWFVWKFALSPQLAATTPGQLMLRGMGFAVAAWLWSLVIAFLLHFAIRQVDQVDVVEATLRTSAAAVWFAPATILMIHLSPLALPVALVLVINATRLLYSDWRQIHSEPERVTILVPQEAWLLGSGELPAQFFPHHFGPALLIACAIQTAGAAELMRHTLAAAALFALSAALLTVFAISAGAWDEARRPSLPRTIMGLLLTVMLAGTITLVGLAGGGGGDETGVDGGDDPLGLNHHGASKTTAAKKLQQPADSGKKGVEQAAAKPAEDKPDVPVVTGPAVDGSYPGVILWPEIKPVTVLIEPMPAIGGKFARATHPFVIPFGGEYWMWRFLLPRPPRNSFFQRGSPAKLSFSTTDHWPMQMEAHQKLEQDIDLSCCGRIQIGVSNADRYPGTVTLELLAGGFSLGKAMVTSVPDLSKDPVQPVSETLDYAVPAELAGRPINEFKVVYQRLRGRTDKSCKVAIERFVLVPRGM